MHYQPFLAVDLDLSVFSLPSEFHSLHETKNSKTHAQLSEIKFRM